MGRIVDLGSEAITILPTEHGLKEIRCPYERVYPAEEDDKKDVDDNCNYLKMFLHHIHVKFNIVKSG